MQEYTHEQAVADGVNVGYDVYRIETQDHQGRGQAGAASRASSSRTATAAPRRRKYKELDDDLTYTANQLDRDVVAENQIRLVVRTFRDKLPEIFPGRTEVPKTLVFAKTDLHAEDIVRIIREEFGKGNDFCQKITSKTTGKKPDELLARVPQRLQPAHRRHRGHDRHRHRREAAGVPAVHAEHPLARLLRADEGPRLPGHRPRRAAERHAGRQGQDALRHRRCGRRLRGGEVGDEAAGPQAVRAARQDAATWSRPGRPTPTWSPRWRPGWPGWTGRSTPTSSRPIAQAAGGKTLATLCARPADEHRPRRDHAAGAPRSSSCPTGQEPTEEQLRPGRAGADAARPEAVPQPEAAEARSSTAKQALEQVIDEQTQDTLLRAGFDAAALEKARRW